MSESIGVTATSTLPNDQTELLKLIVLHLRVIGFYLQEISGSKEDPDVLRQNIARGTDVVVS